jgi:hypothetical protein
MKTLLRLLSLSMVIFSSVAVLSLGTVGAVDVLDPVCQANPNAEACQENRKSQTPTDNSLYGPNGILTKIVGIISIILGIAAVIMVIVGGFQYSLASGDPKSVDNAKNTVLYAIIGMVIAAVAQGIVIFVLNKL